MLDKGMFMLTHKHPLFVSPKKIKGLQFIYDNIVAPYMQVLFSARLTTNLLYAFSGTIVYNPLS